jgi:hypothetical protein
MHGSKVPDVVLEWVRDERFDAEIDLGMPSFDLEDGGKGGDAQ